MPPFEFKCTNVMMLHAHYMILYIKVQCHNEKNGKISVQLTKTSGLFHS